MDNSSNNVQVFEINDIEWWIGRGTPEQILAAYITATGCNREDATGGTGKLPAALSEEALDALPFYVYDDPEHPDGMTRTFREQLSLEIAIGGPFPRLFASAEF